MKILFTAVVCTVITFAGLAQKDIKRPLPARIDEIKVANEVILYEAANFSGATKTLKTGNYLLSDFNDMASSIKVPAGFVAMIYEHAYDKGGFGRYVDLLEDCADLSQYDLNDKISYILVFAVSNSNGQVWARARNNNGNNVPGHWERKKANGGGPDNKAPGLVLTKEGPPVADLSIPVFRLLIRTITGTAQGDDCDKEVWVRFNNNDQPYYLDYGPDDFKTGAIGDYDVMSPNIRRISDIQFIELGVKGDDMWGVKGIELYINNYHTPIFRQQYQLTYRINSTGNYSKTIMISKELLQSNPQWNTIANNGAELRKPPVPMPFSMIKSLVESSIGNQLHHRPDNKLYWGNTSGVNTVWGDHVEGEMKDGNTLHFDLDLEYEAPGLNPEIDVDFDLVFTCNGDGSITVSTENIKVGCSQAQLFSCNTIISAINTGLTLFGLRRYALDKISSDGNMFGNSFVLKSEGFKCKGVLVNADKSVFIY